MTTDPSRAERQSTSAFGHFGLRSIQRAVTHIVSLKHCFHRVTSLLKNLQSLPISCWVLLKFICPAFKDSHNLASLYLFSLIFSECSLSIGPTSVSLPPTLSPDQAVLWSPWTRLSFSNRAQGLTVRWRSLWLVQITSFFEFQRPNHSALKFKIALNSVSSVVSPPNSCPSAVSGVTSFVTYKGYIFADVVTWGLD